MCRLTALSDLGSPMAASHATMWSRCSNHAIGGLEAVLVTHLLKKSFRLSSTSMLVGWYTSTKASHASPACPLGLEASLHDLMMARGMPVICTFILAKASLFLFKAVCLVVSRVLAVPSGLNLAGIAVSPSKILAYPSISALPMSCSLQSSQLVTSLWKGGM